MPLGYYTSIQENQVTGTLTRFCGVNGTIDRLRSEPAFRRILGARIVTVVQASNCGDKRSRENQSRSTSVFV